MRVTSDNLIIHSTQGSGSKGEEVKAGRGGAGRGGARRADRGYIGNFLLSFIIIIFYFFPVGQVEAAYKSKLYASEKYLGLR